MSRMRVSRIASRWVLACRLTNDRATMRLRNIARTASRFGLIPRRCRKYDSHAAAPCDAAARGFQSSKLAEVSFKKAFVGAVSSLTGE